MPWFSASISIWMVLWAVWVIGAIFGSKTVSRESTPSRLSYALPLVLAVALYSPRAAAFTPWIGARVWPSWVAPLGFVLTLAGVSFAIRARIVLGRMWSGRIGLVEGHELVQRGPFALVRHPIYTGLLTAMLGTAVATLRAGPLVGFAIATAAIVHKLTIEERLLVQQFGPSYVEYSRRVARLVPRVW